MQLRSSDLNVSANSYAAERAALPRPVSEFDVTVSCGAERGNTQDLVAEEVAVAMVYNGVAHVVMMASPCNLEDFALGFSLSEAILNRPEQLFDVDVKVSEKGVSLEMHIAGECFARLREQRRNMVGRTGCGLCGTESLAHAVRQIPRVGPMIIPDDAAIQTALLELRKHQPLQTDTGATHAAAWCAMDGTIELAREDVGRHSALDKLIGAQISAKSAKGSGGYFDGGFALISSRASFEMVQKSAQVGIGCLVAVSAPTAMAIREAKIAGMTLVGFARQGRHVTYVRGSQGRENLEESDK